MTEKNLKSKVRMAPSPTGPLHVGTARTALFNYIFAKKYGAEFLVRIEDTDTERSEKRWEEDILEGFKWLGLEWDGDILRQSDHIDMYKSFLQEMLEKGNAFYCWHTQDELYKEKEKQMERKESPHHICEYRDEDVRGDEDKVTRSIIRLKNDFTETISFYDRVRGWIDFDSKLLGDFSIAKSLDRPLYNFAVAVDDYKQNITHIIRGEDHISNTPKQMLIREAMGVSRLEQAEEEMSKWIEVPDSRENVVIPEYMHIPLILGPDKSKLSKRHGATSVSEYRNGGYLPDAMFNFLALLGWHPKDDQKELMEREETIEEFAVEDIQQTGAVFDIKKLNWMNGNYIRNLELSDFTAMSLPYLADAGLIHLTNDKFQTEIYGEKNFEWLKKVVSMEQERVQTLSEVPEAVEFVFKKPDYEANLLFWKDTSVEELREVLDNLNVIIKEMPEEKWEKTEHIEEVLMEHANEAGDRGKLLWPLRAALTGRKASPGPFEIMAVIGKEETLDRLRLAGEKAEKNI